MSVKVAVRVRPFNSRELDLKSKNCIEMINNKTIITDSSNHSRDYTFDYSFWSHDSFQTSPEGLYIPESDRYADQKKVFSCVGEEVLQNALDGYHCCLFAYGQTGSGKSYSMVGYGANKGIVPETCDELFKRIHTIKSETKQYQVQFSMLEIYNEKIQDLLVPINKRPQGGLKVREHKTMGVFVEDLKKHPVDSYAAIEKLTEIGNRNRTIGSTLMNACSSRAHTIVTIEFRQLEELNKKKTEKLSVINLVDLAGSEKLSKTGAVGDRMKEGCSINKSLTVLGIVISCLAEKSTGKGKNTVVPYRDSVLTRILQNALGGNSKTLMICALSPALNNYDETLSTLRYADQAKKIKCNAIVNESEQDKIIRELKIENDKLKQLLSSLENSKLKDEFYNEKLREMQEQLKNNSLLMKEYDLSYEKQNESDLNIEPLIDLTLPHLFNINEDPILTGKVKYSLKDDIVHIGKKNGNPTPLIILGSLGIKSNHAIIYNEQGKLSIEPFDIECSETIFVNGDKIEIKTELHDLDRLIFAGSSCFLVKIPSEIQQKNDIREEDIDWEFVQKEFMTKIDHQRKLQENALELQRDEELQKKLKSVEEKYIKEKQQTELLLQLQKQEYEEKLHQFEEELTLETEYQRLELEKQQAEIEWKEKKAKLESERAQRDLERQLIRQELEKEEAFKKFKQDERRSLEHKMGKYLTWIIEANLIAKELERNIVFQLDLDYLYKSANDFDKNQGKRKQILQVQIINYEDDYFGHWALSKFRNRYYFIKEIFDRYLELGKPPVLTKEEDPFWDPPEQICLGKAYLKTMSLAYLVDCPCEINILSSIGKIGSLNVNLIPTDSLGIKNLADFCEKEEDFIEDPIKDLNNRRLDFIVKIEQASFPGNEYKDIYVEYEIKNELLENKIFKTNVVFGTKHNPKFCYSYHHNNEKTNEKYIDYLLNGYVYGYDDKYFNKNLGNIRSKKISRTLLINPFKNNAIESSMLLNLQSLNTQKGAPIRSSVNTRLNHDNDEIKEDINEFIPTNKIIKHRHTKSNAHN